jgi:hypothetical protein
MISPTETPGKKVIFRRRPVSRGPGCEAVVQKSDTSVASVSSLLPAGLSEGFVCCGTQMRLGHSIESSRSAIQHFLMFDHGAEWVE